MSTMPPREEDVLRHLADPVSRSYEGAESWPDRLALFHQAVGADRRWPVVPAAVRKYGPPSD